MSTHMQLQPKLPRGRALSTSTLLPRGGTLSPRTPALRGGEFPTCQIRPASRAGFTLVELLVVIGIIALLAALVTPAVMQAQVAARNAALKVEIDMLHMAMMQYKNEYGSFPPAISGTSASDPAVSHIRRLFPRATTPGPASEAAAILVSSTSFTPLNSLVGWLKGYNNNTESPVIGGNREKLYDFDTSRFDNTGSIYFPSGKPGSPYIYLSSAVIKSGTAWPTVSAVSYTVGSNSTVYSIAPKTYAPISRSGTYFNPDTFQILCAGRDEVFSEDANLNGTLDSGEDINSNGKLDLSDDDLSNFWPRTRKEYLDSLNQ